MRIIGNGGHAAVVRDGLQDLPGTEDKYLVAIGDNMARKKEVEGLGTARFSAIFATSATVSTSSSIGDGTAVLSGALAGTRTIIGKHCIINNGAQVDHDCRIGDYAHIAPGAILCGNVTVGEGALIGAGATVIQGITIGEWAVVGAGAVVIRDVPARVTVVGVPARQL